MAPLLDRSDCRRHDGEVSRVANLYRLAKGWPTKTWVNHMGSPEGRDLRLLEHIDYLERLLARARQQISDLMADSEGVAGLHLNGDVCLWDELGESLNLVFSDTLEETDA